MNPREQFDQALKTSISDPYDDLLSFSIDTNGVTLLKLHVNLLKDEALFLNLMETLKAGLPTRYIQVSLEPHEDYNAQDRFNQLRDSLLQGDAGLQIILVLDQEPNQENGNSWTSYLVTGGLIGAGAIAAPVAVSCCLGAAGFTAAGVAAGSVAAGIMGAYGGSIAAGSAFAVLQSVGAAGLGGAGTAIASTVGAAAMGGVTKLFYSLYNRFAGQNNDDEGDEVNELNHQNNDDEGGKADDL